MREEETTLPLYDDNLQQAHRYEHDEGAQQIVAKMRIGLFTVHAFAFGIAIPHCERQQLCRRPKAIEVRATTLVWQ